jgi:pimeloyl-ACP methyl ester carboxylesterase
MKRPVWIGIVLVVIAFLCVAGVVIGAVLVYVLAADPAVANPATDPLSEAGSDGGSLEFLDASLDYVPEFEYAECPFTHTTGRVTCGWLYVPEDRDDLDNTLWVELAVAIIAPRSGGTGGVPVIYLEGGPGDQALIDVEYYWADLPITDDHTLILIDQRGTGYSWPSLNCVEMESGAYGDDYEAGEACAARLMDEGIDLNQYNSEDSAADIRDLIRTLGYAQADLLGVSYGTRLALTVMRDHPAVVRSAILDSVYPPNAHAYTEAPVLALAAFQRLFAGCAAHAACNAAYPQLDQVFAALVAELNRNPATVQYYDDELGEYYDSDLYGDDVIWELLEQMYTTSVIPYLPAYIYALYEGDVERAYDILDDAGFAAEDAYFGVNEAYYYDADYDDWDEDISDAEASFYTVECREEVPFDDYDQAADLLGGYDEDLTAALLSDTEFMLDFCGIWGVARGGSYESDAVVSDIPTLILNGSYDPATPVEWAYLAAETLPNAQTFIFPGFGHAVILDACGVQVIVDFLAQPTATVDAGCISALPNPPDFVILP